jgi:hypothetical protein
VEPLAWVAQENIVEDERGVAHGPGCRWADGQVQALAAEGDVLLRQVPL